MNGKRVAIACHSFRLDGGMGRYVLILTQGLLDLGYKVTVITKKLIVQFLLLMKLNIFKFTQSSFPRN